MEIFDCDARFPGASHDAYIWSTNMVNLHLRHMYQSGRKNFWLLGMVSDFFQILIIIFLNIFLKI